MCDHRTNTKATVHDRRIHTKPTVRSNDTIMHSPVVRLNRKGCGVGYGKLRRSGYNHIVIVNCTGSKYKYLARKPSAIFNASMNAYTANMIINYMGRFVDRSSILGAISI